MLKSQKAIAKTVTMDKLADMEIRSVLMTKRILLVEDNEINIRVATLMLKDAGFTNIIVAQTGAEALSMFSADIDLVILDLGLPDIEGKEVCRQMRSVDMKKHIPIIACTAGAETKEKCLEVGMDDFVQKPILTKKFIYVVKRWLSC